MVMTYRENFLKNASLEGHQWIPQNVSISAAYWQEAREELEEICLRHPILFPNFKKDQIDFDAGKRSKEELEKVDKWGCKWEYDLDGLEGLVVSHPLEDWDKLDEYSAPEVPEVDMEELEKKFKLMEDNDNLKMFSTPHGFFFMRLYYLRGYNNFMMDVAREDPRLDQLADLVASYWEQVFEPYIKAGLDLLFVQDDLGTQDASMLGPKHFKRWLKPSYQRLLLPAREQGVHVMMHHDGYIMDIMDDIIESGVSIINPQDLVNGIDNLAQEVKGRVCINLDVDRQKIIPNGSPGDVHNLIKEEVMKLGSPAGGLMMTVGLYPPTPLENVEALFSALEEYRTYWVGK